MKLTSRMRDLTGQTFNKLTAIEPVSRSANGSVIWKFQCTCGETKEIRGTDVISGSTKSCHGNRPNKYSIDEHKQLYNQWRGMKDRCFSPNVKGAEHYSVKGITMHSTWLNWDDYAAWALANGYKAGLTIDRLDVDGDYAPYNVEYIDRVENTRRGNRDQAIRKLEENMHNLNTVK